jgi:hypothetical protein
MKNTNLLMIGGVAVGVFLAYKLFSKKNGENTSSFDGEFSYARGRRRGRMPSVAKASGCVQTTQNPYPMWCDGKCISCATNCKDCLAIRKKYKMFAEGDNEHLYGADGHLYGADGHLYGADGHLYATGVDGHEFSDENVFFDASGGMMDCPCGTINCQSGDCTRCCKNYEKYKRGTRVGN